MNEENELRISADLDSYNELIKKYSAVKGAIDREVEKIVKSLSKLNQEQLEKRRFDNGLKYIFLDCVGQSLLFRDSKYDVNYKPEPKEEKKEKKTEIKLTPEEQKEIYDKFRNPNLLDEIKKEISKTHLEDDNLKMTLFLIYSSGLLPNPKRRQSMQITSITAGGKDNIQHSCLNHFPDNSYLFLTSATASTLQDDLKDIPILAISEINLFREGGANKENLETIKQRIEGGTSAIKKDLRTNNKNVRFETGEQGVVVFGTTEAEQDEELGTRLMKGTIIATQERIKIVNDNTLNYFSDAEKILLETKKSDSWIKKGLSCFWENPEKYDVVIPYAKFLIGQINGCEIFDNSDVRSQRDIKRLLSLVCSMTWLFQEQRQKTEINGQKFLISEPEDFINTLKYSNEFFNQTYGGFDKRISECLDFIKEHKQENEEYWWVEKIEIQKHIGVKKRETINNYLWSLEQAGLVERHKASDLNQKYGLSTFKGNSVYYKAVQKASNKRLISVQENELKEYLDRRIKEDYEGSKLNVRENRAINSENGRFGLDALKNDDLATDGLAKTDASTDALRTLNSFTDDEIKQAGYTKEQLEEVLKKEQN